MAGRRQTGKKTEPDRRQQAVEQDGTNPRPPEQPRVETKLVEAHWCPRHKRKLIQWKGSHRGSLPTWYCPECEEEGTPIRFQAPAGREIQPGGESFRPNDHLDIFAEKFLGKRTG